MIRSADVARIRTMVRTIADSPDFTQPLPSDWFVFPIVAPLDPPSTIEAMRDEPRTAIISASVRAALSQLRDSGTTVEVALALGIDRAIGNDAAQAIDLAQEAA